MERYGIKGIGIEITDKRRENIIDVFGKSAREYTYRLRKTMTVVSHNDKPLTVEQYAEIAKSQQYGLGDPMIINMLNGIAIGMAMFGDSGISEEDLQRLKYLLESPAKPEENKKAGGFWNW